MNRTQKEQMVAELHGDFAATQGAVLAGYKGLSVKEFMEVRKIFRDKGVTLKVVKNSLAKIAVEGTPLDCIANDFVGPIAIAYSLEDPLTAAKAAADCAKEQDKFEILCGYADNERLDAGSVSELAKMPGKDELRAQLLGMFMAPAQQLVQVMNAVPQQVAVLLSARQTKLEEGGGDE